MNRKGLSKALLLYAIFLPVGLMTACGGGGGTTTTDTSSSTVDGGTNSGTGGGGSGTTTTETYLAYQGSVNLVDPANPSSPINVTINPIIDTSVLFAISSYNNSTKEYSGMHYHSIYWIEEADGDTNIWNGGPVYTLSMIKGSQIPTKQQLSNVQNACIIAYSEDDPIGKKKYFVVTTAGLDEKCGTSDDGKVLIHNGMTATDVPIDMTNKDIITSIDGGPSSPGITGFLVFNGSNRTIEKCDTNLSNCTTLQSGVTMVDEFETNLNNGNNYICVDGNLYVFDGTNLKSIGVVCYFDWNTTVDSNAVYAVDNNGNVVKLTHGGSRWQTIYSGGNAVYINESTQNYLIVDLTTGEKVAISKNGGNSIYLTSTVAYFNVAIGNKVYFTEITYDVDSNITSIKACEWIEGSSAPICSNNSYYAGVSFATDGTVNTSGASPLPVYRLLRVDGVDLTKGYPSGGTLMAVNPSDGSTTNLGTVPKDFYVFGSGIGNHILLKGKENQNFKYDVFYVNLSQPNSLQNLTNTPDKDEYPIY